MIPKGASPMIGGVVCGGLTANDAARPGKGIGMLIWRVVCGMSSPATSVRPPPRRKPWFIASGLRGQSERSADRPDS